MVGYCVAYSDVRDADTYGKYSAQAPGVIKQYGGGIRVRGGRYKLLEGPSVADRIVMLEFESTEQIKTFYDSAEYQEILKIRLGAAQLSMAAVEGDALGSDVPEKAGYIIVKAAVSNWDALKNYGAAATPTLKQFGGRMFANGSMVSLEGDHPGDHMVMLCFDSFDTAVAWYDSAEYKVACKAREGAADMQFVAVEGA